VQAPLAELLRLLELERLELDLFRGESRDIGSPQVFGGQVLGQALRAAYGTIAAGHIAHSLHAYFLKRGDFNAPIVYSVDRSRDGHSFSSRRVTAVQHGEQIFHMAASFQIPEVGVEHQLPMPELPPPESLPTAAVPPETLARLPEKMRRFFGRARPFEVRLVNPVDLLHPSAESPMQAVWLRATDPLPDDDELHRCLLAYVSDYYLLNTSMRPHALRFLSKNLTIASIDHAMWFHRPMRVDQWFVHVLDSPSASGCRGFSRGSIFTREGELVASTAQEGLLRMTMPPA
jgi:acyl-CoA thioesterase-2